MPSEHTPGPWKLVRMLAPNGSRYWRIQSNDVYVGDVFRTVAQVYPATADHCQANATLIARAPELLEETERLKQRIEQLEEERAQCDSALRSIRAYGMLPRRYVDEINEVLGE